MEILFESNLLNNIDSYLVKGKLSIFYEESACWILEIIEDILRRKRIEYKKYLYLDSINDGIEGVINVVGIGTSKLCKELGSEAFEFMFIPSSLDFDGILYNNSFVLNNQIFMGKVENHTPKLCLIDKKIVSKFSEEEYAGAIGQIVFYQVNSLTIEKYNLENKEQIIKELINISLNTKKLEYWGLGKAFSNISNYSYGIGLFFLSLAIIKIMDVCLNIKEDLCIPIDFDDKIKKTAKMFSVSQVEIISKLNELNSLEVCSYIFNEDRDEYRSKINVINSQIEYYIKCFKKCFFNRGYNLTINPEEVISYVSNYSILLNKDTILFQLLILGLY